ncbi:MAG: alpha/beta fold hydrolase [Clostridia bacterium]|nr:alpha/beta fold hydrolase [Clostridia bacterium]
MKKHTKGLLTAAGIAAGAAVLGALYNVTIHKLVELALNREEPKVIDPEKGRDLIMGSSELSKTLSTIMDRAAELEQRDSERLELVAHDGITLVGHWIAPPQPKRVIIAMHGWRSSWSHDFGMIADFWYEQGCAVLYAEQRAQGGSGGDYMGFGVLERFDCRDWATFIHERTGGKLPVYLAGISMGATTVMMATALELPSSVCGILADCGFTSPHAIWKHVVEENLHLPYGLYSAAASELYKRKVQFKADEICCTDALRNCTIPVLFIHGTDDRFVPVEMTYENYKACAAEKQLFVVPGADHGLSYLVDREGYETAVKEFWQDREGLKSFKK